MHCQTSTVQHKVLLKFVCKAIKLISNRLKVFIASHNLFSFKKFRVTKNLRPLTNKIGNLSKIENAKAISTFDVTTL